MENTPKTEERAKKHIDLDPIDFNAIGEVKIITTDEFATMVNDVMTSVFKDYYGCKMTVQYMPDRKAYYVIPSIFFQVLGKDQYEDSTTAFKPLSVTSTDTLVNRVQRISRITHTPGAKVDITDDAKDMLEEFMITPAGKNQKIEWNNCYTAHGTDTGTYIEMFRIDAIKLLKKIFSDHDEYGSELYYQITPMYQLNAVQQYRRNDTWVLMITRLNNDIEISTANSLGMYVAPKSGIDVITATSSK